MTLPFLILGAVMLLGEMLGPVARHGAHVALRARSSRAAVVVLAIVSFAYFWPILSDQVITNAQWLHRMWFKHWI